MKAIYSMEQMQELSGFLNELTVTGIHNCKMIALCAQIIDNPTEIEEGEEDEPKAE